MSDDIELKIYFDEDYHFLSRAPRQAVITEYLRQLEKEFQMLFNETCTIVGLQNLYHTDVPLSLVIQRCFKPGDSAFPLRSIVTTSPGKLVVQILKLPVYDAETNQLAASGNPRRCVPYCQPLAPKTRCSDQCQVCGEIKAHPPCPGQFCTRFCYSSDARKMKSQGAEFCSICLGRLRSGKYNQKCMHQCSVCHRPWLVLSRAGVCRTCHALIRQEYYGDRQGFKQDHVWVLGDNAIDIDNDALIQETKRVGLSILERYPENERIIDKIQYNTKGRQREDDD